jgi:hypothetical protein
MEKFTIPWDDGSGDNFYLDFSTVDPSNPVIPVSSDENNTGAERTKIIRLRGANTYNTQPQADAVLKIVQQIDNLIVASFENMVSIYNTKRAGYIE